ncbi:MAG: large-conductance mechanosensitive channel protein MscL [Bacteroidales bacterium]|nr:large-conductance mechanosensitive channel protein MscL [Bacteroidales bacterium]MBR2135186.1 large-conductance mechanosensitive channel protein MscL [Bacteroidales bacterium]
MGKLLNEFKEFAVKGNAVDMAVAVVIGGAFGAIVTSLVNDLIMPCIGVLIGGTDFANLAITLKEAVVENGETVKEAVLFKYGQFINAIITFLIVAFSIFLVVKALNKLKRKKEEAPAAPAEPSAEEKLLTEIRDLLKEKK